MKGDYKKDLKTHKLIIDASSECLFWFFLAGTGGQTS